MCRFLCSVFCVWIAVKVGVFINQAFVSTIVSCDVLCRAQQLGLEAQWHETRATDGAVMRLTRVRRASNALQPCRPVLLSTGLLQSGRSWLDAGDAALAPLLATTTDLWLLDPRGTVHSRPTTEQHRHFSADDIGLHDLPAAIDYILNSTQTPSLSYIGFSQGAGTFFIMCSEKPEYNKKVNVMIALAPATRIQRMRSIARYFFLFFAAAEAQLNKLGIWEVMPKSGVIQSLYEQICVLSVNMCEVIKNLFDSPNPGSIDPSTFLIAAADFPSGTSVRNLARYGQNIQSGKFQKYDYGPKGNFQNYGSKTPPVYNLSTITVPTVIMYSKEDHLVDVSNIKWLVKQLPNVVSTFEVKDPKWSHMDFIMSQNIPKYIYPTIKTYLDTYSKC